MLFEELGFTYLGPIDGHDLKVLRSYLEKVKAMDGPILLHVLTNKGHGFEPAVKDPVKFHAPAPFKKAENGIIPLKSSSSRTYTDAVSAALFEACRRDSRVAILTAAMCEGNKLQKVRDSFPNQFFDVGICESHAVAFAAGMAKAGAAGRRHLQHVPPALVRSDLPGSRASGSTRRLLPRPRRSGRRRRPTHHGSYDMAYLRVFPNMVVMAPGDQLDVEPMLDFALGHTSPVPIRYPRANLEVVDRDPSPSSLARPRFWNGKPTA